MCACVCACVCTRACWDVMLCGTLGFKYDFARSQIKVTCERTRSYTLCVSARARARAFLYVCVLSIGIHPTPHKKKKRRKIEGSAVYANYVALFTNESQSM